MEECRIDFETEAATDLRKHGAARYFACPFFRPLIARYQIGDQPRKGWRWGEPCPDDLREHIAAGRPIRAFNASFERGVLNWLADNAGWPRPSIEQFRCTAAEAAAMSLPRSLAGVGEALGLAIQKDKRGDALIRKFSMPRRTRKGEPPGVYFNEPEDFPEDFADFIAYCDRDVEVEAAVAARIVELSAYERAVYHLDQRINDRGIRIDRTSAVAAIELARKAKAQLDREMRIATGGYVQKCSEPGKLLAWVQAQGVEMNTAQKAEVTELLARPDLPPQVRRAVELRQEAAKTSVSKIRAMLDRVSADGRVRGTFLYHGASTGRWTSMGVNFANLPRPRKMFEKANLDPATLFDAFRTGEPAALPLLYGPDLGRPMHLLSDAIRGFIWAAPGHDLIQADYTSIEGAVIAWSSGEDWKLAAMREVAADPARFPDLYRRAAAQITGKTTDEITKDHPLRQSVGKISELALGFGGGTRAFYSMAKAYGVDLDALYDPVWATADEERREKAVKRYESVSQTGKEASAELSRQAWIACEIIKVGWRKTNPAIAAGWKLREDAVRDAISRPGAVVECLKFKYIVRHGFLWTMLPSGRCLAYGSPKLTEQVWVARKLEDGSFGPAETADRSEAEALEMKGEGRIESAAAPRISALGVNSVTKKWERFNLYGGLLAENDTQAIARDLLVNGMFKAEAAGYPVIAHVYDEIITEVPKWFGDVADFERLICELPDWAEGLPLSASGWRAKRYKKD